jgi:hypothetical protein
MIDTIVLSAFPGTGKSYFCNTDVAYMPQNFAIDSDSSKFSWVVTNGIKERNPEFPSNYIKHIKEGIGKHKFIFVSSHKEVRDALVKEDIDFTLVYPDRLLKEEYIDRYKKRGNDDNFITLVEKNWDMWLDELEKQGGCKHLVLGSEKYLSNTNLESNE